MSPSTKQIWAPVPGTSWQIVLNAALAIDPTAPAITPDVQVYDIDLFDNSAQTVAALRSLGKRAIAYFSAGTWEEWRTDARRFPSEGLGKVMDDWPGEKWLDIRSPAVRALMVERIQMAAEKGFDAIDPDNIDGYSHKTGFPLTKTDSIDYIKFLSREAHARGMSVGLKNASEIVPLVLGDVEFQVNEECVKYKETRAFAPFIHSGKAVFHIEYPKGAPGKVSDKTRASIARTDGLAGFSTVLKTMDLDGWVQYCDGTQFSTAVMK